MSLIHKRPPSRHLATHMTMQNPFTKALLCTRFPTWKSLSPSRDSPLVSRPTSSNTDLFSKISRGFRVTETGRSDRFQEAAEHKVVTKSGTHQTNRDCGDSWPHVIIQGFNFRCVDRSLARCIYIWNLQLCGKCCITVWWNKIKFRQMLPELKNEVEIFDRRSLKRWNPWIAHGGTYGVREPHWRKNSGARGYQLHVDRLCGVARQSVQLGDLLFLRPTVPHRITSIDLPWHPPNLRVAQRL